MLWAQGGGADEEGGVLEGLVLLPVSVVPRSTTLTHVISVSDLRHVHYLRSELRAIMHKVWIMHESIKNLYFTNRLIKSLVVLFIQQGPR